MAWIKVESSVARNKKFVKAGPAASWLWLCGLAYCQEGLTDGFIPEEALAYLGVKQARHLAACLVLAGLWDATDGGWRVHDYLEHNRSAADVETIRAKRGSGGKLGGRPPKNLPVNLQGLPRETFPVAVVAGDVGDELKEEGDPPMDVWARELVNLYPAQGRCSWHLVERPLFAALTGWMNLTVRGAWAALQERLEQHQRSHQWRVKQMIPRLDKWLREGMYLQELPEAPVSTLVNDKTVRTLTSGEHFVREGSK